MSEKVPTIGVDSVWSFLRRLSSVAGLTQHADSSALQRERRRYKRIPMAGQVSYRESGTDTWDTGWIQDFSYGGIKVTAPQPLPPGQTLDLRITLPIHNDTTELEGQVVWTNLRKDTEGLFDFGVSFSKPSIYQVQVIDAAANEMVTLALQSANELSAHQALSTEDLQSSLGLTYKEHGPDWTGTGEEWAHYCNKWVFYNDAATFLLKSNDQIFGTITLVQDSEFGLPSDSFFPKELSSLRSPGRRLAEVTLLALDSELLTVRFAKTELGRLAAFIRLLKIVYDYAQPLGVTDLVIAATPAYQNTFSYLLFNPLTNLINPAHTEQLVLMHLDIAHTRVDRRNMHAGILAYLYDTFPAVATSASLL